MQGLNELITAAMQLAGDDTVSHGARLWKTEGGRRCPLDWDECSQAVYVDLKTGEYDYGEPGGPGHADCVRRCPHGMEPPPPEEEPERGIRQAPRQGQGCIQVEAGTAQAGQAVGPNA